MRERRLLRTASIPSKHRGRSVGTEMRDSLVVRRLNGVTSPEYSDVTSSLDGIVLPNGEAMTRIKSSRLRRDLKNKLSSAEYNERSLEFLIRLIKSGPLARDQVNDENRQPPPSPTSPVAATNGEDYECESESTNYVTDYVIINSSHRLKRRPVTSDPATRFKKSIEDLKSARERFGVCMSVNGAIAKVRNVQQKNLKSRKEGRDKLPALSGSWSSECSDCEKHVTTKKRYGVITPLGPWLSLSGHRIQLKHQGHVERVLGQPGIGQAERSRDAKRRGAKSAPPRASVKEIPIRQLAWSGGNKYIMQKVHNSFRNVKSPISFSASYHGFHSPTPPLDKQETSWEAPDEAPMEENTHTPHLPTPNTREVKATKVERDSLKPRPPPLCPPTPPSSCHSNDSTLSATMPRPVRSVVIKLPKPDL